MDEFENAKNAEEKYESKNKNYEGRCVNLMLMYLCKMLLNNKQE